METEDLDVSQLKCLDYMRADSKLPVLWGGPWTWLRDEQLLHDEQEDEDRKIEFLDLGCVSQDRSGSPFKI